MLKRVMSRYSFEMFFSHSTKKLRRGSVLCFTKVLVSKIFWIREAGGEGGSITIFCRKILTDSAVNFHGGTLLCCVSECFR